MNGHHAAILAAGARAPDFALHATPDQLVSLSDFRVLNPSFNRPVITAAGHPRLLLPFEAGVNFLAAMGENAQPLSVLQDVAQRWLPNLLR